MNIEYLADHKDDIPILVRWFYEEWDYFYHDQTLEDIERLIGERTNKNKIPVAMVAYIGKELVGTVCIKENDMDTRLDLTPWLAGLYVSVSRRKQGIGSKLVLAIEKKAKELGVKKLYLYTPESESFYSKLGWHIKEKTKYHGYPVTIMQKEFVLYQSI